MKFFTAILAGFFLFPLPDAYAQRAGSFFCLANDDSARVMYHTDTFKADPSITAQQYQDGFSNALKAQGKSLAVDCKFTDNTSAIPGYLNGLKQQCSDCAIYTLQRLAWNPQATATATEEAADGAPYPTKKNMLQGQSACANFNETNYRQLALSGEPDTQLKAMCGQAYEYYTMYKRAIKQGYSEADANRTYAAHEGAARNAVSFYENNRAN